MSSENGKISVIDLQKKGVLLVEDGNHGEYRPLKNEFCEIGTAFIRAADLGDGKISFSSAEKINTDATLRIRKGVGKAGDVLISHKGTLGKIGFAREGSPPFVCSPQTTFWRVLNEQVIDRYYLFAYMRSPQFKRVFSVCGGETDMAPYVSLTSQRSIELRLPQIRIQRAIGEIVHSLDDKIELNRKTNETLEAMAKALFKSWFVDFDPVRAKAEGRPTGLPAEISDLFPDSFEDSELGEIPKGWRVAPVGDVVECVGGSTPSTNEPEYWDGGEYFWATPKDLSSLSEPFLLDTAKKITADGVQRISSGILPVGTVLLSSRAPVGYVAAACVPVSINQGFIALRSNGLMSSAYLLNWCLSNVQQFKDRASGTTFAEISKAAFRPIPLLVPSEQVARSFSDKAQVLYERVVSNMRQSTLLAATRDSLLLKLISGEIRIPDAEKMLKEVDV
jgi:type I restriction enzyme S subunit